MWIHRIFFEFAGKKKKKHTQTQIEFLVEFFTIKWFFSLKKQTQAGKLQKYAFVQRV